MDRVPITLPHTENDAKLRPMIGAVIYVRVSDPRQAENLSLATQLNIFRTTTVSAGFRLRPAGVSGSMTVVA